MFYRDVSNTVVHGITCKWQWLYRPEKHWTIWNLGQFSVYKTHMVSGSMFFYTRFSILTTRALQTWKSYLTFFFFKNEKNKSKLSRGVSSDATHPTRRMLQAEDLPVRWLVTNTNSTWSPGCKVTPSATSDVWKNNFLPSSISYVRKPNWPAELNKVRDQPIYSFQWIFRSNFTTMNCFTILFTQIIEFGIQYRYLTNICFSLEKN